MQVSTRYDNPLTYKIFIDRYAAKSVDRSELKPDKLVVCLVNSETGLRELGTIVSIDGRNVVVKLTTGVDEGKEQVFDEDQLELPTELTLDQLKDRVAKAVGATPDLVNSFKNILKDFEFVPAGRMLAGAGIDSVLTAFNCYVIPCPVDSRKGINDSLGVMTEIMSRGGGVGINLSSLRPRGSVVKGVKGRSSGAVSWGEEYNSRTSKVEQGGSRRGATMLMLDDWHPDIFEFIQSKVKDENYMSQCNISVRFSDTFMEALKNDEDWNLEFPITTTKDYNKIWDGNLKKWKESGKETLIYKTVKAKELWNSFTAASWSKGEPGVSFYDRCNELSNSNYYEAGYICATNPCITGDTLIAVVDGRKAVPIKQLVEEGKDVLVYCKDNVGNITVRMGKNPRKTGNNVETLKLVLDDGSFVKLTPNHKCLLQWENEKEAKDLLPGDVLSSFDDKFILPVKTNEDSLRIFYNRRVVSVEKNSLEDVYNLTVDDYHNYALITNTKENINSGIFVLNCGEQNLPGNSCCNLGHLALFQFSTMERLEQVTRAAVRFLDSIYDIAVFISPEIEKQALGERRIGLGTLGLAELLIKQGITYGDNEECIQYIDNLYFNIAKWAYLESVELAKEKGPFTWCDKEKHSQLPFVKQLNARMKIADNGNAIDLEALIREHGIRNVCLLTQAPTGTVGTMLNTSTGIEPFPLFEQVRKGRIGEYTSRAWVVQQYMEEKGIETLAELPPYFVTSIGFRSISLNDHVATQVAIQKWTDSSISKTNNMPSSATPEDVGAFYLELYNRGAKGGTIYRDRSRDTQVISAVDKKEKVVLAPYKRVADSAGRVSWTTQLETPVGRLFVTITFIDDEPYEVFLLIGKSGTEIAACCEALGRICSIFLQINATSTPFLRLQKLKNHLRGIGGGEQVGFGPNKIRSLPDGVGRALELYLQQCEETRNLITHTQLDICPQCGSPSLESTSGCAKCNNCGFSKC